MMVTHREVDFDLLLRRNDAENVHFVGEILNTKTKFEILGETDQLSGVFVVADPRVVAHSVPH